MLKYPLLLIFISLSFYPVEAQVHKVSEKFLIEAAGKGSPRLDEIEAALLDVKLREGGAQEEFVPELFGLGSHAETNERALVAFQPIFSPVTQVQLGVRQGLRNGLSASASVLTDQRSSGTSPFAGKFRDATTTTFNFTMQLDLWKNLFGRLSKARLDFAELETKNAQIQKEIQTKTFKVSLRRVYWALVSNNEALKISEALLKTAQRQVQDARLRLKNSVADADEVDRYEAQVSARQSSIVYLKFQRETYLTQLRNLLPDQLKSGKIVLDDYNLQQTIANVLVCATGIAGHKGVPYEYTKYDEVSGLLRRMRTAKSTLNSRYADADVKLFGTLKTTGVSSVDSGNNTFHGSYGGSLDDITGTNRTGYEVGVMFSLPLGQVKESIQKTRELYDEKRMMASIINTDTRVANVHHELVSALGYLNEVIANQRLTVEQLARRLTGMKKKYQQARVSVNDLIMDQDALFNSELTIIDTQLQVLNLLFDYLVVFTDTPCAFNRI